jgi:hypothetical protein
VTLQPCPRKWQVEAARDGRITGKDLESASRHRETCAECSAEERDLSGLGQGLAVLPEVPRDALAARRTRQRLMASLNESVLETPRAGAMRRVALFAALGMAAAGTLFGVTRRRPAVRGHERIIEVHAAPGARWSESEDELVERVELFDGFVSFLVHPHPGKRVVVVLPDGELEDMGTVFGVRVVGQRTQHVAVSAGRVLVHLGGKPAFELRASQTWDLAVDLPVAPSVPPPVQSAVPPPSVVATLSRPALKETAPPPRAAASTPLVGGAPSASSPAAIRQDASANASRADVQAAKAEDLAYLGIVDALRQGRYEDARARAKAYLLRFPSGFRRIEVLNIATRGANDAPDADTL